MILDFYKSCIFGIGFFSAIKSIFGGSKEGKKAGNIQSQATDRAIDEQRRQFDTVRADLAPFKNAGTRAISGLESLITDPNAQLDFIQNNPFFQALAERSTNNLLNNQAAKGKVGSGETAEALQNSLLLLGNDLLQQRIGNQTNLVGMGQNAATQTGQFSAASTSNITDLITGGANARAAGIVGDRNADNQTFGSLLNAGASIGSAFLLSDIQAKENLERIGVTAKGLNVYKYTYKGSDTPQIGVIAQEVEKVMPDAVIEKNGVKYVDYSKVN